MVRDSFPQVRLFANESNTGYAEGNNQGIAASTGRYVLLLNPDTEITEGTFDTLIERLNAHEHTAAISPKLIGPDGLVQSSCRSFPEPLPVLFEYIKLSKIFHKSRLFGAYRMTYFDYDEEILKTWLKEPGYFEPTKDWDNERSFDGQFL
jgi:GT2 family glycosyltransferase